MIKSYPDIPIERDEDDLLGISIFVDSLSEFILKCTTPMTIAIQGDWGSGKTSIMNMIKRRIEKNVITVWFNTWQYSQFKMASELPISLLSYLIEKISDESGKQNMLNTISKVLKSAALFTSKVVVENLAGETLANVVGSLGSNPMLDYAREIDNIKKEFQSIVAKRTEKEGKERVVIFIDDLDRLAPDVAVEVLEVLKLFLDVEKCVFVLAVDYEVVSQGIKKKFGDMVPEEKSKSFFDKIIQLPFRVPLEYYQVDRFVERTLNDWGLNADQKEIGIYKDLIINSIGANPRSMKRLFNSFQLLKEIAAKRSSNQQISNNTLRLLFAILCMQMVHEDLYVYLLNHKDEFLDEGFFNVEDSKSLASKIYGESRNYDAKKAEKMFSFYEAFLKAAQLDEDESLSEEEIRNIYEILNLSSITSHSAVDSTEGQDSFLRYICRGVAKELVNIINKKIRNGFSLYQGRNSLEAHCQRQISINDFILTIDFEIIPKDDGLWLKFKVFNYRYKDKKWFEENFDKIFNGLNYIKETENPSCLIVTLFNEAIFDNVKTSKIDYSKIAKCAYDKTSETLKEVLRRLDSLAKIE
ncbi:MAG: hypothetical protein PWQ34_2118 [Caldanaerobacter sp.]|uniref:KAP family P-loop NTPase fold protein n=1 Tax=Caldanaerobacter sp. TaxID=2930036 RepID=UPI0024AC0134|nr:P-loop NTPase fold protein [Caldanaerobacter sp.]MDI3519971.1 hypothetical protein [Caldanaerobacter sp.]